MADGASPGRGYGALEAYLPTSPLAPVPDTARALGARAPMGGDAPGAGARSRAVVSRRASGVGDVGARARAQHRDGRPVGVFPGPERGGGLRVLRRGSGWGGVP